MDVYRYVGGLASFLFVILHLSVAAPKDIMQTKVKLPFTPKFAGCPMYQVGQNIPTKEVTLDETLTFAVKPNYPMLIMDIAISEQHRYKATMDASRIALLKCNVDYSDCTELKGEATKSSDIFKANKWNYVNVSLVEDQITVTVNLKQNVMGSVMSMESDDQHQSSVKVSIQGYSDQTNDTLPSNYSVDVNVLCNDTHAPTLEINTFTPTDETMTENPAITEDTTFKTYPAYFPNCSLYDVRQTLPRQTVKFEDAITLAVFPSQPALSMNIMVQENVYKVSIDGTMTQLKKCNKEGNDCIMMSGGGAKDSNMFKANIWSFITILLTDSEITVQVNAKHEVMNKLMVVQSEAEYAEVVILPHGTSGSSSQSTDTDYSVAVNLFCNDTVDPQLIMGTYPTTIPTTTIADTGITTGGMPGDTGKVVEGKDDDEDTNDSPTLIIVLVVLAICLVILVGVLAWHCCKSKRSVDINQHTPLEEQYQQN